MSKVMAKIVIKGKYNIKTFITSDPNLLLMKENQLKNKNNSNEK